MKLTLEEIGKEPERFRLLLLSQNLTEIYRELEKVSFDFTFEFTLEDDNSFFFGHIKKSFVDRGGLYCFTFNDEHLFNSIVFPHLTASEINQLNSIGKFVSDLFDDKTQENKYEKQKSFNFSIMKPVIYAKTRYFNIIYKNENKILLSSQNMSLLLTDFSFNTIYSAILEELKLKFEIYMNEKDLIIDNSIIKLLVYEKMNNIPNTNRFFKGLIKPFYNGFFKDNIDPELKNILENDNSQNPYSLDEISSGNRRSIITLNGNTLEINIGLKNIKTLKSFLKSAIDPVDCDILINTISITMFHYNLLNPNNKKSYFKFKRKIYDENFCSNIFNLVQRNKVDDFYEFEVGETLFYFNKEVIIYDGRSKSTVTNIEELYAYQFKYITENISDILSTDISDIDMRHLDLINMTMF